MQNDFKPMLAILAAVHLELAPLTHRLGPGQKMKCKKPLKLRLYNAPQGPIVVGVTGMGTQAASKAIEELLTLCSPKNILSVGLTGALDEGLKVGDTVMANHCQYLVPESLSEGTPCDVGPGCLERSDPKQLAAWLGVHHKHPLLGTLVTVPQIAANATHKYRLKTLAKSPAVGVDMETAGILQTLARLNRNDVRLYCLRSVSDTIDDSLEVDFSRFHHATGAVQPLRALGYFLSHPVAALRLRRVVTNAKCAADTLAEALWASLSFPPFVNSGGTAACTP